MSGPQRALGYKVSMATGYRAGELRSLTRDSFNFELGVVTCRASIDKRRRAAVTTTAAVVAEELKSWFNADGGCWDGFPEVAPGPRVLSYDLEAAGVPYQIADPDGPLFFDFHSLRKWYVTQLADQPEITIKTLMTLSRHSTPTLSLKVYAESREHGLRDAVDRLPNPGAEPPR